MNFIAIRTGIRYAIRGLAEAVTEVGRGVGTIAGGAYVVLACVFAWAAVVIIGGIACIAWSINWLITPLKPSAGDDHPYPSDERDTD